MHLTVTSAWVIYDTIVFAVGFLLLGRKLTNKEWFVLVVIVAAGITLAIYTGNSETADRDQANNNSQLLAVIARNEARTAKPGLQQDALKMGSTLVDRSTKILMLAARRPFTDFNDKDATAARTQSRIDAVKLMDDYKNTYAPQVKTLRQGFIDQGQDWNNEQYYANPKNVHEIQSVGLDLLQHASRLN